jgi:simple sugar transport system permease protein
MSSIIGTFFLAPWSSPWFIGNTLDGASLLAIAALGIALSFRAGTFNLGGEGQVYLGGLAASLILLHFKSLEGPGALLFAALIAILVGALMAAISGFLKVLTGADELITSFLIAASLSPVADYLISGPLRDPESSLLALPRFSETRSLPHLLPPSSLNLATPIALLLLILAYLILSRTGTGYRLRVAGSNPAFAFFGGIRSELYWTPALAFSGSLHGLTGFFSVAGTYGLCHRGFPSGLGWNAIAVALIARNNPLAIIPAALAYAWLAAGSEAALLSSGINFETAAFVQALVLLLVTMRYLPKFKRRV